MRSMLFATAATIGLICGVAAMAQTTDDIMTPRPGHVPGVGNSEPASNRASNIASSPTRSGVAPRLPGSDTLGDATPGQLLRMAQRDLSQHRTGAAQEALERAETRLLDRSTPQGTTGTPSMDPIAQTVAQARQALGRNDVAGAQSLISRAMTQTGEG